jgi:CelD/BcsL family acetyltransferase involved in cellulose biosynthesis
LYWYKPSFDPAYSRHSPGLVLLHYLVKDAVERGLDEFDFTVGAESFKLRFANEIRTNARFRVFHNGTYYAAALAYGRARRESGRWLRRAGEFVRGDRPRVWP